MIRIVDRREDFVVQKVIDRKHKAVGYQIVLDGVHDAERIIRCSTLAAARKIIRHPDLKRDNYGALCAMAANPNSALARAI